MFDKGQLNKILIIRKGILVDWVKDFKAWDFISIRKKEILVITMQAIVKIFTIIWIIQKNSYISGELVSLMKKQLKILHF